MDINGLFNAKTIKCQTNKEVYVFQQRSMDGTCPFYSAN